MKPPQPPSEDSGQNESAGKLSLVSTSVKKNEDESKPSPPATDPSKNGSEKTLEENQKNSLGSENGNTLSEKPKSAMPVPKPPRTVDRNREALKRLGVSNDQLSSVPPLSSMIKQDAKEMGGQKAVMEALRFAVDDPEIGAFLKAYDAVPSGDRERLPWEAIALSAGINVKHLLGAIHVAVQQHSVNRVKFITVMGHPLIAAARVRYGQLAGGEKDRHAIDLATGFLPSPKPPTFIGKAIYAPGGNMQSSSDDDEDAARTTCCV